MTTPALDVPSSTLPSGASTPVAVGAVTPSEERTEKVRRSDRVQLTDQTNLLPMSKIIPVFLGLGACVVVSALDSVIVDTTLQQL